MSVDDEHGRIVIEPVRTLEAEYLPGIDAGFVAQVRVHRAVPPRPQEACRVMEYLTPQQVLFIHHCLTAAPGGAHRVRDLAALQAAVARPQATFDGADLYPNLFAKAAALFLRRNGFALVVSPEELYIFTMVMAKGEAGPTEARVWLATHTRREKATV